MPEPMPFGLTFLVAMIRATVLASFMNVPSGGKVETVCTLWDHFLLCLCMAEPPWYGGANDVPRHCYQRATHTSSAMRPTAITSRTGKIYRSAASAVLVRPSSPYHHAPNSSHNQFIGSSP